MLERLTIRQKLILILITTCSVAVFLSAIAFLVLSEFTLRNFLKEELNRLSSTIGYNAQAALEFHVEEDAQKLLAGLTIRPTIVFAGIYDSDKKPLAKYIRKGLSLKIPNPPLSRAGYSEMSDMLSLSQPVLQENELLGYVYLRDDMSQIHQLRLQTVGMVLLFLMAALIVAYLLLLRLQSLISGPIIHLAETARLVSDDKNYSLRAKQESSDEVGFLIESFNSMLEQIELRDADLVRSNRELEQFAYVASHDLQEPLRMITSYLQLLQRRYVGKMDEDADEFIGYAVNGAKRMQVLIQDLLSFSRVGTRKMELQEVDVRKMLGVILSTIRPVIKEADAKIEVCDLPTIYSEPSLLSQLFQNLLTNAIKYRGEKIPEVFIGVEQGNQEWVFSVRDNGIGIDQEFAEKIFVIFQRLHTKEEYPGTGIGLAICKKIVERLQGKIWFESVKGEGTTFFVSLPTREKLEPLIAFEEAQKREEAGVEKGG